MDDEHFEQRVRALAHQLWEQEGRPHGQDEEHWHRAAAMIAGEQDAGPAPATPALTEMAGETSDSSLPTKASSSPRKAGTTGKTKGAPSSKLTAANVTTSKPAASKPTPPQPAAAPAATKSKRAPKPAR